MTDEFTKEGLAIDVDGRIRSPRVIEVLSGLVSLVRRAGLPTLRQRPGVRIEGRAAVLDRRARDRHGVDRARQAWQNGVAESFNGKFRDECLSLEWFRSRAEAKVIIETWRRHYNEVRPHMSLGYLTPRSLLARHANPASRHATGRAAADGGLRAPARRTTAPPGQTEQVRVAVSS